MTIRANIRIPRGDDRPVLIDIGEQPAGVAVSAEVLSWPDGPVLHEWKQSAGTAALEEGSVVLLCERNQFWEWTSGMYRVWLKHSGGGQTLAATGNVRVASS